MVLLSTHPLCSPPLTQRGGSASSQGRHGLLGRSPLLPTTENVWTAQIVCTWLNQVFSLILGPNCPYGCFSETQHFTVLSPSLESCRSHLNYHWAPGTDCFLGNSMKIGTQMNCEVHILALEWIFSSLLYCRFNLEPGIRIGKETELVSFQNKRSQECITNDIIYYTMYWMKWQRVI